MSMGESSIIVQGVPKKNETAIFRFNLSQRSDFAFSHVFRNQNFEPVTSTHSEY